MTIDIHIELHPERGPVKNQLDEAMAALGYSRVDLLNSTAYVPPPVDLAATIGSGARIAEAQAETPTRERGKPAPGRARRTREEIAEDDAADKADADAAASAAGHAPDKQIGEEPEIRANPENRQDPANPDPEAVDPPEVAQQDAADEAAETAATRPAEPTREDVRTAIGKYVNLYGFAAGQEDFAKVLDMVCGGKATNISTIPDDMIGKVVAGVEEMIAKNPFGRAPVKAAA